LTNQKKKHHKKTIKFQPSLWLW